MKLTIKGRVVDHVDDFKALMLVLEERDGLKTNTIAVRCYSDRLQQRARDFKRGDQVEAFGELASRQWNGRWFTGFEVEGLRALGAAPPANDGAGDLIK